MSNDGIIADENNIPRLLETMEQLKHLSLQVGIFGENDSDLLMIARVHEFGVSIEVTEKMRKWFLWKGYPLRRDTKHIKIPERSYIRSGFDDNMMSLERLTERLFNQVLSFELSPRDFYERIGVWLVAKLQNRLRALQQPPNSPMTVARKGSSNPLIDSGRLIQSITHRVVSI